MTVGSSLSSEHGLALNISTPHLKMNLKCLFLKNIYVEVTKLKMDWRKLLHSQLIKTATGVNRFLFE